MTAEILTIGDELLIGQVINTNQAYIAEQLNLINIRVARMTSVGDEMDEILPAFQSAWEKYAVVIVTGGLGPTHDDVSTAIWSATTRCADISRNSGSAGICRGRSRPKSRRWFPGKQN